MKVTRRQLREIIKREISTGLQEQSGFRTLEMNDDVTVAGYTIPATVVAKLQGSQGYVIMSHDERDPHPHIKKPTAAQISSVTEQQLTDQVLSRLLQRGRLYVAQPQLLNLARRNTRGARFVEETDWNTISHDMLSVLGLVPVGGEVFDLANATLYLKESPAKIVSALISLISMIGPLGDALKIRGLDRAVLTMLKSQKGKIGELITNFTRSFEFAAKYENQLNDALNDLLRGGQDIAAAKIKDIRDSTRARSIQGLETRAPTGRDTEKA